LFGQLDVGLSAIDADNRSHAERLKLRERHRARRFAARDHTLMHAKGIRKGLVRNWLRPPIVRRRAISAIEARKQAENCAG
jgi:hypothetical protein